MFGNVVITGASSGIGWAMAEKMAKMGANLGLLARREDKLIQLAAKIKSAVPDCKVVICSADVTSKEQVDAAFDKFTRELGPIDMLVANAGVSNAMNILNYDIEQAERIYSTNVFGVLNCIAAVAGQMAHRRSGKIVGVSSIASFSSFPNKHTYCASKVALNFHLKGIRQELRPYNVQVMSLCPGFIKTPLTDANSYKMPMLLELDHGVDKLIAGIISENHLTAFPKPIYWYSRVRNFLPDWLLARIEPVHEVALPKT